MSDKRPLEDEFKNSQTYKALNKLGGEALNTASKVLNEVAGEIGRNLNGNQGKNPPPPPVYPPNNNYNYNPQQPQGAPKQGSYSSNQRNPYEPPKQSRPQQPHPKQGSYNNTNNRHYDPQPGRAQTPPRQNQQTPPPNNGQNPRQSTPHNPSVNPYSATNESYYKGYPQNNSQNTPVQKKKKDKKNKKTSLLGLKIAVPIVLGILLLDLLSFLSMVGLALTAVAVIASLDFLNFITRTKEERLQPRSYLGIRITLCALAASICLTFVPQISILPVGLAAISAVATAYISRAVKIGVNKSKAKRLEYFKEKKKLEKEYKKTKVKVERTGNTDLDTMILNGNEYIEKLKIADKNIEHEGISDNIVRMEKACASIFEYIKEKPEKLSQISKFMNYYLPTTLKLLNDYHKLSLQAYKGQNVTKTMFEIEGMMNTVATAFELQLDNLFSIDSMDIQADISVFESILQQEGLHEKLNEKELK